MDRGYSVLDIVSMPMNIEIVNESAVPTLCLNMIVKNESRIILRLLNSVVDVIDSYCICDTGSTDNTVEIIETFFQSKNIPGKIVREPFVDFAHNRSFALKACESMDCADYILLLDADMIFWKRPDLTPEDFKRGLVHNAYYIFQGSDHFYYKNTRVVKNRLGIHYWGVTHEFVKTPEGTVYGTLKKSNIFINDIGDGGSKSDKFERDIRLLKKGLEDHPNNDRYTFYLANSYRDHGDHKEAIETYKKRIAIGGWVEEVWHSNYSIGKCYKQMGDIPNAIHYWLEAYQVFPKRIENLYEIITHYRQTGKNELAYLFYVIALKQIAMHPNPDYLFLQKDVYDYKLDYEFSVFGYYCNLDKYDMTRICLKVLNCPNTEDHLARNVMSNYKFYSKSLSDCGQPFSDENKTLLLNIGRDLFQNSFPEFVGSTPSISFHRPGELVVVQRYVNYRINSNGGYENGKHISTKNAIAIIDISSPTWKIKTEFEMPYNVELDGVYVGLEDVRIVSDGNQLLYSSNRGIDNHHLMIEHGTINVDDPQSYTSGLVIMENQKQVEKNWVMFQDGNGQWKMIYGWNQLVIGDITPEKELEPDSDDEPDTTSDKPKTSYLFEKTHQIPTPAFFKHIRGSTNGVRIGDEIWFMCHVVSYEDRRYYYHVFVVIDSKTYQIKRYTTMFTFEKQKVEYTLGFVYVETSNQFLIGYSTMDCETKYISVPREAIENLCVSP
jgi:tetratricopeptide (TPR) repeat protein